MSRDLSGIRYRNQQAGLSERSAPADPIGLLRAWLDEAEEAGVYLHNTMVVATVDAGGRPSSRAVLLKRADERGLVFYSNYESKKGRDLERNDRAAFLLLWSELARQIRVTGIVSKAPAAESDQYFATRDRNAQLEAWASEQSHTIPDRAWLEARFEQFDRRFVDQPVPRPDHWGGYRLVPDSFEFWQGRPHRMHDRLLYVRASDGTWTISRLSP